jgi:hypothetical protein
VHLRRALLLFALVLGMTAIAASIAPPPAEEGDETSAGRSPSESSSPEPAGEQRAPFRYPLEGRARPVRRVEPDQPLTVTVSANEPGQAAIPLLGRVSSLTPNDPARIVVLTPDSGSYDVQFTPTEGGEARRIGKIVVEAAR